ncbi:hypothetical protein D3C81_1235240 [compost metagenome]
MVPHSSASLVLYAATPMVRPLRMLFCRAALVYSSRRLGSHSTKSLTSLSQPRGRSWATPPMRYQAGCRRKPVMASITVYARWRSVKVKNTGVMAPTSWM